LTGLNAALYIPCKIYLRKFRKNEISCVLVNKVVQDTASVMIKASIFRKPVQDIS